VPVAVFVSTSSFVAGVRFRIIKKDFLGFLRDAGLIPLSVVFVSG